MDSIYELDGSLSLWYVCAREELKRLRTAKAVVRKIKRGKTLTLDWPIGGKVVRHTTTRTMLVAKGATIDGIYIGDVYMKEGSI